jgi:ferredoxin
MSKFSVTVSTQKCQAHGACLKTAPGVLQLNAEGKAEIVVSALEAGAVASDTVLAAARGCPYRAITVIDAETGLQIFPRARA